MPGRRGNADEGPDPVVDETADNPPSSFKRTGVSVLLTDLDLALTFLKLARTSTDPAIRQRNLENARKARNAIVRLQSKVSPDAEESQAIQEKLSRLEDELKTLSNAAG